VTTFDLHSNHTQRRLDAATAVVGFDTYPHVDMAERGEEAAGLIVRTIRGEIRPVMALRELPLFWSAACQVTNHPPMDEAFGLVHEAEHRQGILSVTLATGFPWADVPQMGASVIVVADRDRELAAGVANEVGDWVWERRTRWHQRPLSVSEALALGERAGRQPIILADMADNTGGGAPGDSTEVLRTFIERDLRGALILYLVDPEVSQQAHRAGVGGRIAVQLGGKSHLVQGPPVPAEMEVVALSDGKFTYDGPMYAGLTGDLGTSAWLRVGALTLKVWQHRHRSKGQCLHIAFVRADVQTAEHDVADHPTTDFGDQRHKSKTASTQSIDQASLTILPESKPIHLANGIVVLIFLGPNINRHGDECLARLDDDRLRQIDPAAITHRCCCQHA
jgi:microcystin degradation protein MlrC